MERTRQLHQNDQRPGVQSAARRASAQRLVGQDQSRSALARLQPDSIQTLERVRHRAARGVDGLPPHARQADVLRRRHLRESTLGGRPRRGLARAPSDVGSADERCGGRGLRRALRQRRRHSRRRVAETSRSTRRAAGVVRIAIHAKAGMVETHATARMGAGERAGSAAQRVEEEHRAAVFAGRAGQIVCAVFDERLAGRDADAHASGQEVVPRALVRPAHRADE